MDSAENKNNLIIYLIFLFQIYSFLFFSSAAVASTDVGTWRHNAIEWWETMDYVEYGGGA